MRPVNSEERGPNSCFKIHTSLIHKYSSLFHFYFAKPISEIVYNDTKSYTNNQAKDLICLADASEYLNRVYYYSNSLGKEEIYDRIRLISGFYTDQVLQSEYPTMFVTNTVKIFKTRERRFRKMIASDGSSDESEHENEDQQSYPSTGFLHSISNTPSQSSLASMFKSVENQISFEAEVYNIYDKEQQTMEICLQTNLNGNTQRNLKHLIFDFEDIDIEKTISDYKLITETINKKNSAEGQLSLSSLASKKPIFQSIIINEGKNTEARMSSVNKYQKLLTERNSAIRASNNMETDQMKWKALNIHNGRNRLSPKLRSRDIQIEEAHSRDWRRQKIRDKAAQLLQRVKSQNYLNGLTDYYKI